MEKNSVEIERKSVAGVRGLKGLGKRTLSTSAALHDHVVFLGYSVAKQKM